MADSLFDQRYRYDYIYPRGRSGETLRAVDTQNNNVPVVVKRPAPNDAPPIRAGQEVSIANERRALKNLSGHPVITELVGEGQFTVGGVTHQYIVLERAEGFIVGDEVLNLAAKGERLPELEMHSIIDRLLDLLYMAHSNDIVYNDVDAKHLFWNRDAYRLKVIDWGNAVFLEGDDATPQGISRQNDIFQVGELLFFILTGGRRVDIPRDADEGFLLDFGDDSENVPERLQTIISKAVHPNKKHRYPYITELRRDLADYRDPIERERDGILARLSERLNRNLSKNELFNLSATLESVKTLDPGYPAVRQIEGQITERLSALDVEAGLDAVRIYMESGNWSRAVQLLDELTDKASPSTAGRVNLLFDLCMIIVDSNISDDAPPQGILSAIDLIYKGQMAQAANALLTTDDESDEVRKTQWLIAERVSSRFPDILLLRPNLYRLELALSTLARDGYSVEDLRNVLRDIRNILDKIASANNVAILRDEYRQIVDQLSALNTRLSTFAIQHSLSNRKLPLSSLDRALNAAMELADNMHVIGKQATSSPRDAMAALDNSRAINPTNPVWDLVSMMLNNLYELLQSYQTYVPSADGSDLKPWLQATQQELTPFVDRLFDEMLVGMVEGLNIAEQAWQDYGDTTIQGNRIGAVTALSDAIEAVSTISPTLSGWLNQLRIVVDGSTYVERNAIYGVLGRALADGWQAYDRSRLGDAERLAQQAYEIARNENERFAATRLRELVRVTRDWVERNAVESAKRSQAALETIESLYTDDENRIRGDFNSQMPSKETYLKAMGKGIVELLGRQSTSAPRILAFNYVLLGTLDAHNRLLDDTDFWREAAIRSLNEETGAQHIIIRTLDEFVKRRKDIEEAARLLNDIHDVKSIKNLGATRSLVEENPQSKTLASAALSLREVEGALRDWSEGEFRSAALRLENAIQYVAEVERTAIIELTQYREWLQMILKNANDLHNQVRVMRQQIEKQPDEPVAYIRDTHQGMAQITLNLLGKDYAVTLIQWRDMYERFLGVYTDNSMRRSQKLERMGELFRALFIDRHPAYPLYRHWQEVVDKSPEFPPPPTDDPTPRMSEEENVVEEEFVPDVEQFDTDYSPIATSSYDDMDIPDDESQGSNRRLWLIIVVVVILVAIGAIVILSGGSGEPEDPNNIAANIEETATDIPLTPTEEQETVDSEDATGLPVIVPSATFASTADVDEFTTPTLRASITGDASLLLDEPTVLPVITPTATETIPPSETPTETATATLTPSPTSTPTNTPTATLTLTPTLPPDGLQGDQDVIALLNRLEPDEQTWDSEQFSLSNDGTFWRLGTGAETPGEEIQIGLSEDVLEKYYGNNATSRLRRTEARISLLTKDPLLPDDEVYFGVMLVPANPSESPEFTDLGVYIQVVNLNAINVYQRYNGELEFISQRSVNSVLGRLRVDRDPTTGLMSIYFNGDRIADPIQLADREMALLPVLFVKDGGVVTSVTSWTVNLR